MSFLFTNEWFVFKNVIDKKTCDRIKNLGRAKWTDSTVESATIITEEERLTGRSLDYEKNTKVRMSDVCWTNEQEVYDLIWPLMLRANKEAGWNLDISAVEPIQITRYQKGGFYTWHKDGSSDSLSAYDLPENSFLHNNVRKISMSLILNDSFDGGDLEFASGHQLDDYSHTLKTGDMIFFTSGMEHRVTPVTKGVRYSLVAWFLGPPIR